METSDIFCHDLTDFNEIIDGNMRHRHLLGNIEKYLDFSESSESAIFLNVKNIHKKFFIRDITKKFACCELILSNNQAYYYFIYSSDLSKKAIMLIDYKRYNPVSFFYKGENILDLFDDILYEMHHEIKFEANICIPILSTLNNFYLVSKTPPYFMINRIQDNYLDLDKGEYIATIDNHIKNNYIKNISSVQLVIKDESHTLNRYKILDNKFFTLLKLKSHKIYSYIIIGKKFYFMIL